MSKKIIKVSGFTLVEMMFVVSVVIVLMLLVIPNVTNKTAMVKEKGCQALVDVIDAQIQLYEINEGHLPGSISDLISAGYIESNQGVCPNGNAISISNGQAYAN